MTVPSRGTKGLNVLSLGYTLDLWDNPAEAFGDPRQGLTGHHESLSSFTLIAHTPHYRKLLPIRLADNSWAYPTNAHTPIDSWFKMFHLARRIAKTVPIDLVQIRDPLFNGGIGYLLSRRLRVPLHACVYGTNPFDPYWERESSFTRMGAPLAKTILRSAAGIQVDGSATARGLAQAGIAEERLAIKPLIPGNLSDFLGAEPDPALRARLSGEGRFQQLILYVGRVEPQKNLESLLEVASRVAVDHPAVRFIVVGDGRLRSKLEREARDRGLSERVVWAGPRSHGQVVTYMRTCDVFVLCSRYEGFARVLMEAAMSGLPIVTTAVSGSDDAVVDGRTGRIVPIDDTEAFSRALTGLISHPDRAAGMGVEARRHIQSLVARYSDPELQVRIWEGTVSRASSSRHRS